MKTFKNLLPAVALIFCFNFLSAQEMTAKKYENLQWYVVTLIKFEDGKIDDAKKIIKEHFIPTDQASGQRGPVMGLDLLFSDWDHIVIFPMDEGIQGLDWEVSPREVEWMKAFNAHTGSEEKGKEVMDEFQSYVKNYKNMLARSTEEP